MNETVVVHFRRVALGLALVSATARAQDTRPDTLMLGAVVVVAERSATPMNRSTAAVTRLTAADLARLPNASLADVLRSVPGFAVVNFDGLGRDPQLMVRGFYGGGEADYVLVLIDGRPVNLAHNGTIAWETLPPIQDIESIEVIRGSASAVHGDAAVAGVVSIATRRRRERTPSWSLEAASMAGTAASVSFPLTLGNDWDANAALVFDHNDGYRDHSSRSAIAARGMVQFMPNWQTSVFRSYRKFDEPGPLIERLLVHGTESDPRFRTDGGEDDEFGASMANRGSLGAGGIVNTTLRFNDRESKLVRTLPLTPDFGDTRERRLRTIGAGATVQADLDANVLPVIEHATVGASLDIGSIDSRYFSGTGSQRTLDAQVDGYRTSIGLFAHLVGSPTNWLRWTIGVRADGLRDAFSAASGDNDATHFAFSPKGGVNVRYSPTGRVWLSASRTFKAPTVDQLFDQRPIPIPFPPFTLTTSNPELDPQRGTSLEAGIYHDALMATGRLSLTMTLYQVAMRDELDFDVQALRYVNIGRSRHRGAEAGLTLARADASVFATMALQDAVTRVGDNAGKRLKAVPGQVWSTGVTWAPPHLGAATVSATRMADMFIDDANTRPIPSWTRVDAQMSRRVGYVEIVFGARNLLDERYSSTGFLDPSGTGEAYYYPAAGRVFTLGVRNGR